MTKKYGRLWLLFAIISVLLNLTPLATCTILAFMADVVLVKKVALATTLFITLILTLICLINKYAMRSRLWIMLIGIYICLDYIMTPLIIIAVCQVLDELIICPVKNNFKNKYTIHKEIDKRI